MELIFQEGSYLIKTLSTHEEMDAAFRLRHDVFVDELKWVPASPDKREIDAYDKFAIPLGLFDLSAQTGDNLPLIGYGRLIQSSYPFMVEKEFASLIPKDKPFKKSPNMVELTRICIKKERRADKVGDLGLTIGHLLYKAVYNLCLIHNSRFLAAVVEKRYYRYLKSLFPFEPVGEFLPMGDGVLAGTVLLDWRDFERVSLERRPDFMEWMTTIQVPLPVHAHAPSGLPLHVSY
ncbi:MAG: acyl-homoserine-lactone synthase [Deltaproteobacteria bacterium]